MAEDVAIAEEFKMGGGATGGEIDDGMRDDGMHIDDAVSEESRAAEDDAAALAMPIASAFARMPRASAKEKLHAFLEARPGGS
jgi:hypothetical protein